MSKHSPVFWPARRKEWFKNAHVGDRRDAGETYADGFFDAAEHVAGRALVGPYRDRLFYPMCFLYRHALEVVLKERIRAVEELIVARAYLEDSLVAEVRTPEQLDEELEELHSLESLLAVLERRLAVLGYVDVIPGDVRAAVIELHNRDARGQTFRYARMKGSGRQTFAVPERFDIERVMQRLGDAFRFLSWGVGGQVSVELDAVHEYIAEVQRADAWER